MTAMHNTRGSCRRLGRPSPAAILSSWDLDAHNIRALISIEPGRCAGMSRKSLVFCGARLSDFHGLVVHMEPRSNRFRLWDVDDGLSEGFGTRFLAQHGGRIWVTNFTTQLKMVDMAVHSQLTWNLGATPAGLVVRRDGHVMMPSSGTPTGAIHRLKPESGRLTTWTLPTEQVPFSGVESSDGAFFFAERRTSRIARFDAGDNRLLEWQLPSGSNPQIISRDRLGRIWFSDANFNNRIGRLNPSRNTVAFFVKEGVVTFSVRPVGRCQSPRQVAASDLASYIDLLRPTPVEEVPVRTMTSRLPHTNQYLKAQRSRVRASEAVIFPTRAQVLGIDPPHLIRFPTPVVAPIDLTSLGGAIYATAGGFNERQGPSRVFRLSRGLTMPCLPHIKTWRMHRGPSNGGQ